MSVIGFRTPIAISAAGVALGVAIVALSPIAHAANMWGACAAPTNPADADYAVCLGDFGYSNQAEAERIALLRCGDSPPQPDRECTVVVSFKDCGAIAQNVSQWVGGRGPNPMAAAQDALRSINNGTIARSACVWQGPQPATPPG
jgi:Domain of unknown function (DUF4189)